MLANNSIISRSESGKWLAKGCGEVSDLGGIINKVLMALAFALMCIVVRVLRGQRIRRLQSVRREVNKS